MLTEKRLSGVFVPVVTPFHANEELDLESYRRYLDQLVRRDIQGLVINGTTGESPALAWEEVAVLVRETKSCLGQAGKSMPIIIGTGTNVTAGTVKRTELAGELGADAVLVVTPYFNRPPQEGVIAHYRKIAEVGVPIIAYEVPYRTGIRLTVDTMRSILDLDGVIGLKDSTGSTELLTALMTQGTKPVLCGDDLQYAAMLELGASGGILASANLRTDVFLQVTRYAQAGQWAEANEVFGTLAPLIRKLFQESNPAPIKWILAEQQLLASDALRLPMMPISKGLQAELRAMWDVVVS